MAYQTDWTSAHRLKRQQTCTTLYKVGRSQYENILIKISSGNKNSGSM